MYASELSAHLHTVANALARFDATPLVWYFREIAHSLENWAQASLNAGLEQARFTYGEPANLAKGMFSNGAYLSRRDRADIEAVIQDILGHN